MSFFKSMHEKFVNVLFTKLQKKKTHSFEWQLWQLKVKMIGILVHAKYVLHFCGKVTLLLKLPISIENFFMCIISWKTDWLLIMHSATNQFVMTCVHLEN